MPTAPTNPGTTSSKSTKSRSKGPNLAKGAPGSKTSATKSQGQVFRGENERHRKIIIERIILASTVVACLLLVVSVWWTRGKVLDSSYNFLARFAGKDALSSREAAMNCRDPRNENTPYCIEHNAAIEASWQSMSRYQGGKSNAFSLHGGGK